MKHRKIEITGIEITGTHPYNEKKGCVPNKIIRGEMIKIFVHCLALIFFIGLLQGCIPQDHIISRPTIEKSPDWEMVESCECEGCLPMVDFLSAGDIRIRIQAFNHMKSPNLFLITVGFLGKDFYELKSDEYEFDSSAVTVKLSNGMVLKPKGFTCSYTKWDKQYLRSASAIEGAMPIQKNSCFLLFFDYPPPSVEEEFVLNLKGLKRKGKTVEVPIVLFKKGTSRY